MRGSLSSYGAVADIGSGRGTGVGPGSGGGIGGGMGGGVGPAQAKRADAEVGSPQPAPPASSPAKPLMDSSQKRPERKDLAQQKLDRSLVGLAEKLARQGKNGQLKLDKIDIKNGKVRVAVWLNKEASKCLEKLKAVGLEPSTGAKSVRMVLGRIAVDKLDALANLDCVARIEPPI